MATVRLIVGEERKKFTIEEDVLCAHCPFFENAVQRGFIEAQTKTVTFPDDEPELFGYLIDWLRCLGLCQFEWDGTWLLLARLWLFGDKYHIDELQNDIINSLYRKFAAQTEGINISYETLEFVVQNTTRRSSLRRIFVDMLTNGIPLQQLYSQIESIPSALVQDMFIALKRDTFKNAPTSVSLLSAPISTYYSVPRANKEIAVPDTGTVQPDRLCESISCDLIDNTSRTRVSQPLYLCREYGMLLCHSCWKWSCKDKHDHEESLEIISKPYVDPILGLSKVLHAEWREGGFICDGPMCNPEGVSLMDHPWFQMYGERYECVDCQNMTFCTVCIRYALPCKKLGHKMVRIGPVRGKAVELVDRVPIRQRQILTQEGRCWLCGSDNHETLDCSVPEHQRLQPMPQTVVED